MVVVNIQFVPTGQHAAAYFAPYLTRLECERVFVKRSRYDFARRNPCYQLVFRYVWRAADYLRLALAVVYMADFKLVGIRMFFAFNYSGYYYAFIFFRQVYDFFYLAKLGADFFH